MWGWLTAAGSAADLTAATRHLHLVVHDYTTVAGAEGLAEQTVADLGGIDDLVAPH